LIEDLRLQVDVRAESATTPAGTTASAAAFEDLLLEIDHLRSVSDRIETLADKHSGMEDGLLNVAGNIRSLATILDVFTLIRSKAGGSQEDAPLPQTNGYVN
jgi:prophage DNA circulation protein